MLQLVSVGDSKPDNVIGNRTKRWIPNSVDIPYLVTEYESALCFMQNIAK